MKISPEKCETMTFLGQDPVRCKIVVDNKWLQQVKNLKFLGCEISYENERDIEQKLAKFAQELEILNNTFKPVLVQKISRIKVYNAPALPFLLYGSENRTGKKKDEKRLTSIEIKIFRRTAGTPCLTTKGMKKFWKS
jgi:hypothetical protein